MGPHPVAVLLFERRHWVVVSTGCASPGPFPWPRSATLPQRRTLDPASCAPASASTRLQPQGGVPNRDDASRARTGPCADGAQREHVSDGLDAEVVVVRAQAVWRPTRTRVDRLELRAPIAIRVADMARHTRPGAVILEPRLFRVFFADPSVRAGVGHAPILRSETSTQSIRVGSHRRIRCRRVQSAQSWHRSRPDSRCGHDSRGSQGRAVSLVSGARVVHGRALT
jgi:hypothetical protein